MEYASAVTKVPLKHFRDGSTIDEESIFGAQAIFDFHRYVRRFLLDKSEAELDGFAKKLYEENPELVLITDEIGYGIVPLEKEERRYREAVGRVCTDLCRRADRVDRVVCGIGMRLK